MYYVNLKREMERNRIGQSDIAKVIGTDEVVVFLKINASLSFTFLEAAIIRSRFFPDQEIGYLFKVDENMHHNKGVRRHPG